jgi:cellulose synthase/poly-beta-1,6-N-acetylglucosamine synthase-like glycosyltransferase
VGFWDAFNVTEDADLGLRLARMGYSIRTISSKTEEEAPTELSALLRQRTRWMKGWMQTALAHCRRPDRLVADLGPRRALAALAMFTGSFAGPLLAPAFIILFLWEALYGRLLDPITTMEVIGSTFACVLALSGAGAIVWPMIVAMRTRELTAHWPTLFLLPLWMLMLSAAAWRALFELWRRPYHWEKTEHGVALRGGKANDAASLSGKEPLFE